MGNFRGKSVTLVPLESDYLEQLWEAAANESLRLWTANIVKSKVDL